MFYFDKENPEVLFADNRELQTTLCDGRSLLIKPDVNMDFRNMPYPDNTFKIVVFDPPPFACWSEILVSTKIWDLAKRMESVS